MSNSTLVGSTPYMTVVLPDGYNWAVLSAVILCIECIMHSLLVVVRNRMKFFTPEFMEQFADIHKANITEGSMPAPGGFPDMGNGLYSDKLPYAHWY